MGRPKIKKDAVEKRFEISLVERGMSPNTRETYIFAVRQFRKQFKTFNKTNLLLYRNWLIENFTAKTANVRITAINVYLEFIEHKEWSIKVFKIQQKPFLENVISEADYEFLKKKLKKDGDMEGYFTVRFLGATGARISEFLQLKVEHVYAGYFDLYGKGSKMRRLYIPEALQKDALRWLRKENRTTGYLIATKDGEKFTREGITQRLKRYAKKYGLDPKCVYPHSFRHRFAKNFLARFNDISFLADLMGHESIETTRIYLRKSSTEQREIVDKVITW